MKRTLILLPLPVAAAVLVALALPNDLFALGNPLLGFVCLVPYFAAIALSSSFRAASLLGIIFGGLSTLLVHYWLMFYGDYSIWTVGGVTLGYMGYHALAAPIMRGLARANPHYRPFVLAAAWALYEYLKSSGFLAFPWGLLPHAFSDFLPLAQFIDITGLWGLSLLVALANSVTAEIVMYYVTGLRSGKRRITRQLAFLASLLALAGAYGVYRMAAPIGAAKSVRVVLVQHNENPWVFGGADEAILKMQDLSMGPLKRTQPDIVVWSETAIKYYIREEQFDGVMRRVPRQRPLLDFIRDAATYFLIGAPLMPDGTEEFRNSALFISPAGKLLGHYGKQQLVPLGESVPFWDFRPVEIFFSEVLNLTQGWGRGTEYTLFTLPLSTGETLRFGVPICFEDAFPDLCRRFIKSGAELWFNLTNVSWSRRKSAEVQMLVAARFRCIENRRVMVRATNGGVTAVIGPKGEILHSLDVFVEQALAATVPVYSEPRLTPYTVYGDYLPHLLIALLLGFLILCRVRGYRNQQFLI